MIGCHWGSVSISHSAILAPVLTFNWHFVFGAVKCDWLLILALQTTFNLHYFFYVVFELVTNSLSYTAAMMIISVLNRLTYIGCCRTNNYQKQSPYNTLHCDMGCIIENCLFDFLQLIPPNNSFYQKKIIWSEQMLKIIIGKKLFFLHIITESTGVEVHEILDDGIVIFGRYETMVQTLIIIEKEHSANGEIMAPYVLESTASTSSEPIVENVHTPINETAPNLIETLFRGIKIFVNCQGCRENLKKKLPIPVACVLHTKQ
jgi:hypothetical protein